MGRKAHREATHKTCTKCGDTKALDRFAFFAGKKRRSWCVDCRRAYNNSKAAELRVRTRAVRDAFRAKRKLRSQPCST